MGKKAVFIDLQGTLGGEGIGDIRNFTFFPFSFDAIKIINENDLLALIITNQSHISKGYFSLQEYENCAEKLRAEVYKKSLQIFLLSKEKEMENSKFIIQKEKLEIANTKFNYNSITENDLKAAEYSLESKALDLENVEKKLYIADLDIKKLLNLPYDGVKIIVNGELKMTEFTVLAIGKIVAAAIETNTEIYADTKKLEATQKTMDFTKELFRQAKI
jgi:outer membrane protein TolC